MVILEETLARMRELYGIVGGSLFHLYTVVLESPSTGKTETFNAVAAPGAHVVVDSDRYYPLIIGEDILRSPDELERVVAPPLGERLRFDVPRGLPHYQRAPLPKGITLGDAEERAVIYHRRDWTPIERASMLIETGKSRLRPD